VGVVARPHGLRGELRVRLHNPDSGVLSDLTEIEIEGRGRYAILGARPERDAVLLRLVGCQTREAAEALRGLSLRVPRAALPAPDEDEYYFCDLVGLRVVDPEGTPRGRVRDVHEGPGHATLLVDCDDGRGIEVPMAEAWVLSVEIAAGRIVIRDLDALAP
jgi:16S rRNA processing protein RimM